MTDQICTDRRTVLKTAGGLVAGSTILAGSGIAVDGRGGESEADMDGGGGLPSTIESHGHYAWFPLGPESWGRSAEPYEREEGESRWLAQPTDEGGVRVLVANLATEPPNRNAGFDVHLGPVAELEAITVDARTLQTSNTTGPAVLVLGLYLDKNDDGEFFAWEATDATEQFVGFGGDDEGLASAGASGEITIDGDTAFTLAGAGTQTTLSELQAGSVEGITGETAAALYVGVANGGEGTDEVIIDDVNVTRL